MDSKIIPLKREATENETLWTPDQVAGIRKALRQLDEGKGIPHAEIEREWGM